MDKKISKDIKILLNVYNAENDIDTFFNSLKKQTYQTFSILIIDDGSTDNTIKKIEKYSSFFDIKIIKRSHQGLRKARSYGVNQADCDILIIADSDLILEQNAISELIKPLMIDPKIAAVGGVLKNAEKGIITESYSELRNFFIKLRSKEDGEVDWVNGGFCAVRKKIIDEIGGYTKQETSEDLDISWRIRKKGYKLHLASDATAYHRDPKNFKEIWRREFNTGKREYYLGKKHKSQAYTLKRLIRFYPAILPLFVIVLFLLYWQLIPIILILILIPAIVILKGRIIVRIASLLTFNVMNFAYCSGFFLSFFKKSN